MTKYIKAVNNLINFWNNKHIYVYFQITRVKFLISNDLKLTLRLRKQTNKKPQQALKSQQNNLQLLQIVIFKFIKRTFFCLFVFFKRCESVQ